jgi:hypothetical protein
LAKAETLVALGTPQFFHLSQQQVEDKAELPAMVVLAVQAAVPDITLSLAALHPQQDKVTLVVHQTLGQVAVAVLVQQVLQVPLVTQVVRAVTV